MVLLGELGLRFLTWVYIYLVTSTLSPFYSVYHTLFPHILLWLTFYAELTWRWSPAVAAAALYPLGGLGPALCTYPCVSGTGQSVVKGLGHAKNGGHCRVFTPRCRGRLLRFGALISRLLPQVLNAWSIGRDSLSPGQEKPYR